MRRARQQRFARFEPITHWSGLEPLEQRVLLSGAALVLATLDVIPLLDPWQSEPLTLAVLPTESEGATLAGVEQIFLDDFEGPYGAALPEALAVADDTWTVGGLSEVFAATASLLVDPGAGSDGALGLVAADASSLSGTSWDDVSVVQMPSAAASATITVMPADDLAAIVASAADGTVIELTAGTFNLSSQGPHAQGVLIENITGLTITGQGDSTIVKLASDVDTGFWFGSNVTDLTIQNMHIQGTPPLSTNTAAIANSTATTNINNITFTDLRITDVAIGIAVIPADGGADNVTITNNIITDLWGNPDNPGWSYGIHTDDTRNQVIRHNYIEGAGRHSIYIRDAKSGATVVIEDNYIVNHTYTGGAGRWYLGAFNIAASFADTRVANNIFVNTSAIAIAIMYDGANVTLLNNQIIGAHYVGIWTESDPPRQYESTVLGNSVILHPSPVGGGWSMEYSNYDMADGHATSNAVEAPNPRWADGDWIYDYTAQLDNYVYVLKSGTLDKITPYTWAYTTSPTTWPNAAGMTALEDAAGEGEDRLYIADDTGLYEVDPDTWAYNFKAGDWSGTQFMAATSGYVYLLKDDVLYRVTPGSLEVTQSTADWSNSLWMWDWGGDLYIYKDADYSLVDPDTFPAAGGPLASYELDEGSGTVAANSASGISDGTIYGAQYITHGNGSALVFDGEDDYVAVADPDLNISTDLTIEGWFRIDDAASTWRGLFGTYISGTGGYMLVYTDSSVAFYEGSEYKYVQAPIPEPVAGTWHHVAGVYDHAAGTMAIYLDGVEMGTVTGAALAPGYDVFDIGRYGGANYFDGAIDDVRVYNQALTATEAQALYYDGGIAHGYISPLVAEYTFEEGAGATVQDSSDYGNHGLIHGAQYIKLQEGEADRGYAMRFPDGNAYIDFADDPSLDLTDAVTIELWMYAETAIDAGTEAGLVGELLDSYTMSYGAGNAYWYVNGSSHYRPAPVPAGAWHHVVGTFNGAELKIYVDGDQIGDTLSIDPPITIDSHGNFQIRRPATYGPVDPDFQLVLDDVRVYRRVLDAAEILSHYDLEVLEKGVDVTWTEAGVGTGVTVPLNNLVSELLSVQTPQTDPLAIYTFTTARDGWIFVSSTASVPVGGRVSLILDTQDGSDTVTEHLPGEASIKEGMRYLPAGDHQLQVYSAGGATAESLVVRAIPEILYAELGYYPTRWLNAAPDFDWEYLQEIRMAENINVVLERTAAHSMDPADWVGAQGKKIIAYATIHDIPQAGATLTAQEFYDYFSTHRGFTEPNRHGVMFDELGPWGFEDEYPAYTEGVAMLAANPDFADRSIYPYTVVMWNPASTLAMPFLEALNDAGSRFAEEVYLGEEPSESWARGDPGVDYGVAYLRYKMNGYLTADPDIAEYMIVNLGDFSAPPESLNRHPGADYKVYLDMQFNVLANDPLFSGLYGVETYHSAFADDEIQRWVARLHRHYWIEGNTEMLSSDPYELPHIQNPDFESGTTGWALTPAEPGSMGTQDVPSYGWLQGRYPQAAYGDTALWTRRSDVAPNLASQTVTNLTPGRLYSAKMMTADYQEYVLRSSAESAHQGSLTLDGAELIEDRSVTTMFRSGLAGHTYDGFDRDNNLWISYDSIVFRALDTSATITISDWPDDQGPGGPVGQELMFNFIEVQPYFDTEISWEQVENASPLIAQGDSVTADPMDEDGTPTGWSVPVISATDSDGDSLTWSLAAAPAHGTATVSGTGASPTELEYTPDPDWTGDDSFQVQVSDGIGGTDSVTIEVTVNQPPGEIHGLKWADFNGDGLRDEGEPGLAGVTIYLDLNENGVLDDGEPSIVTLADDLGTVGVDETGMYRLADLPAGTHVVAEVVPEGYEQTYPVAAAPGTLTLVDVLTDGGTDNQGNTVDGLHSTARSVVSPDGRHVYVTSEADHSVSVFSRDLATGALTFVEILRDDGTDSQGNTIDGLFVAVGLAVTDDGKHVYAGGWLDHAVAVFRRDSETGRLIFVEKLRDGALDGQGNTIDGLNQISNVVASSDGRHVYTVSYEDHAVAVFSRDDSTGLLTFVEALKNGQTDGQGNEISGLSRAVGLAVSGDGKHVYATGSDSDTVVVFSRDQSTGELTVVETLTNGETDGQGNTISGLDGVARVEVSADGSSVYTTAGANNALAVFGRDQSTGELTFVQMLQDGGTDGQGNPLDHLAGAAGLALSADGDHVYVGSQTESAITVFGRDQLTGELTLVEALSAGLTDSQGNPVGLLSMFSPTVSGDGRHVYVALNADSGLATFSRHPDGQVHSVTVANGQVVEDIDFGNLWASSRIQGLKWHDLDGDGVREEGEPGLAGVTIYLDLNENGELDDGEPSAVTLADDPGTVGFDEAGMYLFEDVPLSTYAVAEVVPEGYEQTYPLPAGAGRLTLVEVLTDGGLDGDGNVVDGLQYAARSVVSADGKHVYVTADGDSSVSVFSRDEVTGALTFVEILKDGGVDGQGNLIDGLYIASALAISGDDQHVYAGGWLDHSLVVFSRDASTGRLTFVDQLQQGTLDGQGQPIDGLQQISNIAVSSDGKHVYATGYDSGTVAVFNRDAASGNLTFVQVLREGQDDGQGNTVSGLLQATGLALSSDGLQVYATGYDSHAVVVFSRDAASGELTYVQTLTDGALDGAGNLITGLENVVHIQISGDGAFVYTAAGNIDAVTLFSRDPVTGTLTFVETLKDGELDGQGNLIDGLDGASGLTLSPDGAQLYVPATNDRAVALFSRDEVTGRLTFIEMLGDSLALNIATVSGDGRHVYIAANADHALAVFSRNPGRRAHNVTIVAGQAIEDIDFANFERVTLSGVKFEDLDGNGVQDGGELGLEGWTIELDLDADGSMDMAAVTQAGGSYSFVGIGSGTHRIREVQQEGWWQTSAYPADITVGSGQDVDGIDFGNQSVPRQIHGHKWNDLNGNGQLDDDEPGIAGVTIYLDLNSNGELNDGEPETLTLPDNPGTPEIDETGNYVFLNPPPGSYPVAEVAPDGYQQTYPILANGTGELTLVATVAGPAGGGGSTTSIDGRHVYTTSDGSSSVSVYSRDPISGELTFVEILFDGGTDSQGNVIDGLYIAAAVTVSGDDRHVYVTGWLDHAVVVFRRIASTGQLIFVEMLKDDALDGQGNPIDGLRGTSDVTVSGDGRHAYATSYDEAAVTVFNRDEITGKLTFVATLKNGQQDGQGNTIEGLAKASSVTVSGDNWHVYVAGLEDNAVVVFNRDQSTGELTLVEVLRDGQTDGQGNPLTGLLEVGYTRVSPDGRHVYAVGIGSHAVVVFSRDAVTGRLTFVEALAEGGTDGQGNPIDGLVGPRNPVISADGSHVYVAAYIDRAMTVFSRDSETGRLTVVEMLSEGLIDSHGNAFDPLEYMSAAITGDGRHLYAPTQAGGDIAVFSRDAGARPGPHQVTLDEADVLTGLDFGNAQTSAIHGTKWHDLDGDGVRDEGEPGLPGVLVYIDLNGNGQPDPGEPSAVTMVDDSATPDIDETGMYWIEGVTPGTHIVAEVVPDGYQQTYPSATSGAGGGGGVGNLDLVGLLQNGLTDREGNLVEDLQNPNRAIVSDDGKHVYVAAINGVVVFSRDQLTGELVYVESLLHGGLDSQGNGPIDGLYVTAGITISQDGRHVYAAGWLSDTIIVFSRNQTTGQLIYTQRLRNTQPDNEGNLILGLEQPSSLSISPDGKHLYATGYVADTVVLFSRDEDTGWLSFVELVQDGQVAGQPETVDGLEQATSVAVSSDGQHVYVAGNADDAVAVFSRDQTTGKLTFIETLKNGLTDGEGNLISGLDGIGVVRLDGEGRHVYATASTDDAVVVFSRDQTTGKLTFVEVLADGEYDGEGNLIVGLDGVSGFTITDDGSHAYAAARWDGAITQFNRDLVTGRLTVVELVDVDSAGWSDATVSIGNDVYVLADESHLIAAFSSDAGAQTHTVTVANGNIVEDIDFANFELVTISGKKFDDRNENGIQDGAEQGLEGWTIELDLDADGWVDRTTQTTTDGTYSFIDVGPGTHRIREVQQPGWWQTTADPADISVTSGQDVDGIDFGNRTWYGAIGDLVWNDPNSNGLWDQGEPGIDDVTVRLYLDDGATLLKTTVTANGGLYEFANLEAGSYWVDVDDTSAALAAFELTAGPDPRQVVIAVDQEIDDIDFGYFKLVSVYYTPVAFIGGNNAAWADFNNDGWVDLAAQGEIWQNNAGVFQNIGGFGAPGIWGDYDNDGFIDLYTWYNGGALRRNNLGDGGEWFTTVEFPTLAGSISNGATFVDINNDGYLDIYSGGYETWPSAYYPDSLVINQQGLGWVVSWEQPIDAVITAGRPRPARGITTADFDQDGDQDIYVSYYRIERNGLWINDGNGNIVDEAVARGAWAGYSHTIGSVWADFDNDGYLDLFAGNFSHPGQPAAQFLRNTGPAGGYTFELMNALDGADWQESYASPAAGDIDNDGDLDLIFTTVYGGDNTRVYRNDGNWVFTDITAEIGLAGRNPTYQAAFADYDNDGDLDLILDEWIFRNDNTSGNWLKVHLIGDGVNVNTTAIGAQARINLGGDVLTRQVEGATGQGNQNEQTLHFGLGNYTASVEINILWPDGTTQTVTTPVDRTLTVEYGIEPRSELHGTVWHDQNGDGIQDPGEPGIDGLTVNLLDGSGTQLASTTTSGGGAYGFEDLAAGNYIVQFVAPLGQIFTVQDQGADDALDSDVGRLNGRTAIITLAADESNDTVDAGVVEPALGYGIVDLSDLDGPLPLDVIATTQILWQTEDWEHSSYGNPGWPEGGHESLGYPTVVKNDRGLNPDGKYYLYYSHHDPMSGIGVAVADNIEGPYIKLADMPGSGATNSMVLTVPNYNPAGPNPDDPSHYSSPSLVWNDDEQLWFLYFHYYNHYWGGAGGEPWSVNNPGLGQQMTGLATTADLSSHNWTIWTDPVWGEVSVWDIVPVLPTTDEAWMESQSSYHAMYRLPDGQWLAFLRGTAASGAPTVGFATSDNGRNWSYFPQNPVIGPGKPWTVDTSEYRPAFIGYLGENGSGQDEYLVAWSEHSNPHVIYSTTTDFLTFERDTRGYATLAGVDGPVSARREGDRLYLFAGKNVYEMVLPITTASLSVADVQVAEGGQSATVTVTLTGTSSSQVSANYATGDGTATAGADYSAATGTLTWDAGTSGDKTFTVAITDDFIDESDETVNITLSNAQNATIADGDAVLTIQDDDRGVPYPFIVMYGHSDGAGVHDAFRAITPPFTVLEGTSTDADFINEMRAQGVVYAAHVNNSASATTAELVAAWRAPFDNDLGGQLPGGYDAIAIDELLAASTDGTTNSNNVSAALQQLRSLYPDKMIFVAAVWQYGQNSGAYSDQLNAVNTYADMLMQEKYMREGNLSYWSSAYADNLKAAVPGILSKTVFGLWIAQHGFVADDRTDVGFWGLLDEQFHRIRNDADAATMPGVMFWAYYRTEIELTPDYVARLVDHYYVQGNTSYFGDGDAGQLVSNPSFEPDTSGWILTPGTGGTVQRINYASAGVRDNHSADPIRNMGQGPQYISHGSFGLKTIRGTTHNEVSYEQTGIDTSKVYTVSAWVLASTDSNKAKVTITESDGTYIASEEITHAGTYDYARIAFNFTPTSDTIRIVLNDENTSQGTTLYWDFVELEDAYPVVDPTALIGDRVWSDGDGDGVQDAGEVGIDGVTLRLYLDDGDGVFADDGSDALLATTATAGGGLYDFSGLAAGAYWVDVDDASPALDGFALTAGPDPRLVLLTTDQQFSDADFGYQSLLGQIHGRKWHDLDGDGMHDEGEPGLVGWTIELDLNADGSVDRTTQTLADGSYSFADVVAGTHRLREIQQQGWTQTTADPSDITVTSGDDVGGIDFGNFELVTLSGVKFDDLNGDGARDVGESGLEGWTIELDLGADGSVDLTTQTLADGSYNFTDVPPGTHRIRELQQTGWLQTTVEPDDITVSSGQNVGDLDFGNFELVMLSGVKFEDEDGNGQKDPGENGLPGWTIELDLDADGSVDLTTQTLADGSYSFADVGPGTHRLREVQQPGWMQTTPDPSDITVIGGDDVEGIDFGNFEVVTLSGVKFEDDDGDGEQDAGDSGVAGWTIELDLDADGSVDRTTQTLADGSYTFTDVGPGTHRLREVQQQGWTQTTSDPSDNTVTSGDDAGGIDFGNYELVTLSGMKFEDEDGDGVKETNESGLEGWTIVLIDPSDESVIDSTTTAADGSYSFGGVGPGNYRVREVAQSGWALMTPNPADLTATSGIDVAGIDFGNVQVLTHDGMEDPGKWTTQGDVEFLELDGDPVAQLNEGSDAAISQIVALTTNAGLLLFKYRFVAPGDGDRLIATIDGQEIFSVPVPGSIDPDSNFMSTGPMDISKFAGLDVLLEIRLVSTDAVDAQVQVDDVVIIAGDMETILFGGKIKAQYIDANGNTVTVSLSGPGDGVVIKPFGNANAASIEVSDTTSRSKLKIATSPGTETAVADIVVNGSMNQIVAKTTDLLDDLTVTGTLKKLQLDDVADNHVISIGPPTSSKDTLSVTLDRVANLTFNSQTPIKTFTVTEWLDSDADPDWLMAPWLGSLKTKGKKKLGVAGDFEASLLLNGTGSPTLTLRSAKIVGNFGSGDVDNPAVWDITGNVGTIAADKGTVNGWTLDLHSNIKSLKLGRVTDATVNIDGSAGSISVKQWLAGSIHADSIKSLKSSGDKKRGLAGDFRAALTLDGSAIPSVKYTLASAKIAGDLGSGEALSPIKWDITGAVASIDASKGTVEGWTLDLHSNIKTLKLGLVEQADLTIAGDVGAIRASQWNQGQILAGSIRSLTTKLNSKVPGADGDFMADIELTGSADPTIKYALGSAKIAGGIIDVFWDIRVGAVGPITAAILDGSTIRAGIREDVPEHRLPDSLADFTAFGSRIVSLKLTGRKGQPDGTPTFINSILAAWSLGKLKLGVVDTNNGALAFGLAAHTFESIDGETESETLPGGPPFATTDFADFKLVVVET